VQRIHRVILALAAAATIPISLAPAQSDTVVAVTGGQVNGRALHAGAVFQRILFAAPPVGDLRWKQPMPVKPWASVSRRQRVRATWAQIDANWNKMAAERGQ
jgi:para-nitrobenzyl esterase